MKPLKLLKRSLGAQGWEDDSEELFSKGCKERAIAGLSYAIKRCCSVKGGVI